MMKPKTDEAILQDILEAIRSIDEYTSGIDFEIFVTDSMRQDAVIRRLEIIGEASTRLSSKFIDNNRDFPIQEAKGMRNFLIHDYDAVSAEVIWKTIKQDLPLLKSEIERSLN